MYHNFKLVIILSLFVISCSQKKTNETKVFKKNESPIALPSIEELPVDKVEQFYEVKKGDTLYSIGRRLNLDYKKIAAWNDIKTNYEIEVGQKLRLGDLSIKGRQNKKNNEEAIPPTLTYIEELKKKRFHQQSLQRTQMVVDVLAANPQLEIARAVWQASTAKIKQKGSLKDPVLAYSLAPLTVDSESTDFAQQVQLSQQLPWPGKLALQSDAAMPNANRDEEKINLLRLELTALAKKLYGDWFFIHQAHQIHHENVQLLNQVNKIATIRYRTGKATKQEVLQSELELSLIEQHAFILNQQKTEILGHINTLLSQKEDTPLALAKTLPQPLALKKIKFLQKNELENHPKIKALSAEIKSLELKKQRAVLEAFPDFNVNAGYSTRMNDSDKHFTVGVAFNLPLNLSKYQAIEDEAVARLKQAQWKKHDQVQKLAELIQLYYSRVKKYHHTLGLYKRYILPLAKLNKRAALADYQAGYGGFLELIRAEKDWHSAQLKEKQALVDYHESLALLEYAVGVTELSEDDDS